MKRLAVLLCSTILLLGTAVQAQKAIKLGHIDSQALFEQMPERADAVKKMEQFQLELEDQLKAMSTEYQNKLQEYQQKVAAGTMTDLVKKTKEQEIMDLEKRIQEFQGSAQQDLQNKEMELLQPIFDKAKAAIKKVADANGFTYILDSSKGGGVLYFDNGTDIMPLVKKELGITTANK